MLTFCFPPLLFIDDFSSIYYITSREEIDNILKIISVNLHTYRLNIFFLIMQDYLLYNIKSISFLGKKEVFEISQDAGFFF